MKAGRYVIRMEDAGMDDLALVGGKNASLGEMLRELSSKGIRVPTGFVVTAEAYRLFIREAGLDDFIRSSLESLEHGDLRSLESVSAEVRARIKSAPMPPAMEAQIAAGYRIMEKRYGRNIDVAIRSSATAEDLPDASFAGEHDTYLGVRGEKDVVRSVKSCFASLFTARAINYRLDKGFDHFSVALSVAIQRMVATHRGASGVMFTIDTETGFRDLVLINGAWGLGEMVVQGRVVPDEFLVAKKMLGKAPNPVIGKRLGGKHEKMVYSSKGSVGPTTIVKTSAAERNSFVLSDTQALQLANWAKAIEEHYSKKRGTYSPMDIEWGLDGKTGELFILQARPETVQVWKDRGRIREYVRLEDGEVLAKGLSVGNKIVSGVARVIGSVEDMEDLKPGEILITEMTDPDWEPVMKKAGAIVTDKGGRTSHAAIVSRELGLTAIVGAETVTKRLKTGQVITVDTTSAEGVIFKGALRFDVREHAVLNGCDCWPAIREELAGIALLQWPWSTRAMDEAGAALDALEPEAVVTYAEAGGWGRAVVLEARRRGIPSIGLQHGFIYRHWLNYLHEPDEMEPDPERPDDRGFPHPTLTLLFDGYAADHLELFPNL